MAVYSRELVSGETVNAQTDRMADDENHVIAGKKRGRGLGTNFIFSVKTSLMSHEIPHLVVIISGFCFGVVSLTEASVLAT